MADATKNIKELKEKIINLRKQHPNLEEQKDEQQQVQQEEDDQFGCQ